jgi:quinol monooxygenase YgiN
MSARVGCDPRRILYAEFTALPGCVARVAQLVIELGDCVRAEPGNLVFAASRRATDPSAFFVYEEYVDEAAFQKHIAADYGVQFDAELKALVHTGASTLTWLQPVDLASRG